MDDKSAALVVGTLLTLGFGVFVAVAAAGSSQSAVGGTPASNGLTRWPEEDRGRGTTNYSGGSGGFGVNLGLSLGNNPDLLTDTDDGSLPASWCKHKQRYPARSGEVLEAVMYGPGLVAPPIPRESRAWIFAPPSREDV